jgi:hypothetical protein
LREENRLAEEQKTQAAKADQKDSGNSTAKAGTSASTYSHEYLIENGPAIFNVAPFVVAGALSSVDKVELSREDAETAVNTFLGK